MADEEILDVVEVSVVQSANPVARSSTVRWGLAALGVLLLTGGVWVLAAPDDSPRSQAAVPLTADTIDATTDQSTPDTTDPLSATTDGTVPDTATDVTTTQPQHASGGGAPDRNTCERWIVPNFVGLTWPEALALQDRCVSSVGIKFWPKTLGIGLEPLEYPCAPDPALVDHVAGQSPAAGSTLPGGFTNIQISYYRDCPPTTPATVPDSVSDTWIAPPPETVAP